MQVTRVASTADEWARYASVDVGKVPKLDRFFPDCELGLIELFARSEWGCKNLKKVWFSNTFDYERPNRAAWLAPNGIELAASMRPAWDVRDVAFRRLEQYYGIQTTRCVFDGFGPLLANVHAALERRRPVLTCLDMSFLQSESRAKGLFQPHMVAIIGWNASASTLALVDQVRGRVDIPFAHYEQSFSRFREHQRDFYLLECSRLQHEPPPLTPEAIRADIRRAVDNLFSPEPNLGLNAVSELARDVASAVDAEQRAFAIPGLWIVSHDRFAAREGLPYWAEAGVVGGATLAALDQTLQAAFAGWFDVDMGIERSLHEQNPERMRAVSGAIRKVSDVEQRLAELLRKVLAS